MNDFKAIVAFIAANHVDYRRRLILADWYEEHGSMKAAARQREFVAMMDQAEDKTFFVYPNISVFMTKNRKSVCVRFDRNGGISFLNVGDHRMKEARNIRDRKQRSTLKREKRKQWLRNFPLPT